MGSRATGALLSVLVLAAVGSGPAWAAGSPTPQPPGADNPLGPIVDVTAHWQWFQPASTFCVKPDVYEFPSGTDATASGADPACSFSGFRPTDTGLYRVSLATPPLCQNCRRLFIDYSKIPSSSNPLGPYYARGHAYFHLSSENPGYSVGTEAHSPNIKNLTNDKLVAPDGSPQAAVIGALDPHFIAYTGDTRNFAHIAVQGPYYVGPWYVNTAGKRVTGTYLDVSLADAQRLSPSTLNAIGYWAGFNAGDATCPDNELLAGKYADGNYFYGGCADHFGVSHDTVDPWPR